MTPKLIARLILVGSLVVFAAAPSAQPSPQPLALRPAGKPRYRFSIKSALVTPGRLDGRKWRGNGRLSPEVVKGLGKLASEGAKLLMAERTGSSLVAAAFDVGIPWLADALGNHQDAPNVALTIWQGGRFPLTFPRDPGSGNTINPTWPNFHTGEIELDPGDELTIEARDVDNEKNLERIGLCTMVAPPRVDNLGFVSRESLRCEGGLVALSLRAVEISGAQALTAYVPYSAALRPIRVAKLTGPAVFAPQSAAPAKPIPLPAAAVVAPGPRPSPPVLETPPAIFRPAPADPVAARLGAAERALPPGAVRATNIFHNQFASIGSIEIPVILNRGCYRIVAASQKTGALLTLSLENGWADTKGQKKGSGLLVAPDPVLGSDRSLCIGGGLYRINVGALGNAGTVGVVAYRLPQ